MSLTITQDNVLGRIRIDATGLAAADVASIERSTDQITWTMCRGGSAWPVTAGAFSNPFDDYEFPDGVVVYYRVRGIETGAITFVSHATTASDANAAGNVTLAPSLPATMLDHDAMFLWANIRNSGTGTVNTPTGWTPIAANGNIALFGRYYVTGDGAPTVSFTGGVANATISAKILAFRRASIEALVTAPGTPAANGASSTIVSYPALNVTEDGCVVLACGWRQDDATSVNAIAGYTELQDVPLTAGDDVHLILDYLIETDATGLAAGSWTVTGGSSAISRALLAAMPHADFLNEQTGSITPDLTGVWIKSLRRPYLNRIVNVLEYSDITRESNNGVFRVLGRTYPVGVADVMGARKWTMTVWTETGSDADDLDTVLAAGDIWFVHVPIDCTVPGGYVVIDGGVTRRKTRPHAVRRHFDLPFAEVAAPDDDVAGSSSTWATVLANYATWGDLIADKATWADVLELIGSADEVIVP